MGIKPTEKKTAIFRSDSGQILGQHQLTEHQPAGSRLGGPIPCRPLRHQLVGTVIRQRGSEQGLRSLSTVSALTLQQPAQPIAQTAQYRSGLTWAHIIYLGTIRMLAQLNSCK